PRRHAAPECPRTACYRRTSHTQLLPRNRRRPGQPAPRREAASGDRGVADRGKVGQGRRRLAEERRERAPLRPLALELLEQRGAVHAEQSRRLLLVATREVERLRDDPVLDPLHLAV